MVALRELRDLTCSEFEEAADGWAALSSQAAVARDRVDNEMVAKLRDSQEGEAAEQAMSRLIRLSRNYHYIHVECGLIRTALNGLAKELAVPQKKLKAALEEAGAKKFTVQDDGSVRYPAPVPLAPDTDGARPGEGTVLTQPRSPQAQAQDIADRIASALSDATEIDERYARTLRRLRTNGDLKVTTPMWDDALNDMRAVRKTVGEYVSKDSIPDSKSPGENATWWNSLSQEEREEFVSLYPASIGALDGIPAEVRDDANRTVLAQTRADVQTELKQLGTGPEKELALPGDWREWHEKKTRLESQLKGIRAIQERFDQTGVTGLPEVYLLAFSTDGNGRAVIANGNPDTADHTAVYVPGTGSNLGNANGDIERMVALWRDSAALAGNETISTVTWIGYDAPQSAIPIMDGDIIPEASSHSYANEAAPKLNQFLEGIQVSQGGAGNSHTTVIGHSYGSTVIGAASNEGNLAADDIVVAGSPGMLVGHADDLDVGSEHVWAQAAATIKDPVPVGGKIVGLGDDNGDITDYAKKVLVFPFGYIAAQNVPSDEDFGANIMATDSGDHSGYWEPGSLSLRNQAAVVTQNYGNIRE